MISRGSLFVSGSVLCLACAVPACSSSPSAHPLPISAAGSAGSTVSLAGAAAGGSAGIAGGDAGTGGNGELAGETGTDADAGTGRPPPGPPLCSETAVWSGATKLPGVSTAANEVLLSATPDELDLAFLRDGALYVVHRALATDDFVVGSPTAVPSGWAAIHGVALSADGKRLVLVSDPDQKELGELTRATRDGAFSTAVDQTAFAAINMDAVYTGRIYASPVASATDGQLVFNSTFPGSSSIVVVSTRSGADPWTAPVQLGALLLDGDATSRRLPTGISADERTLFYFNEQSQKEEARWRDEPNSTSPLSDMVDLGTRRGAAPNSACDRLYSESASDVVVETD